MRIIKKDNRQYRNNFSKIINDFDSQKDDSNEERKNENTYVSVEDESNESNLSYGHSIESEIDNINN
ncbi:MAG: hypothetical protein RSD09_06150 [Bacilli bacterium]